VCVHDARMYLHTCVYCSPPPWTPSLWWWLLDFQKICNSWTCKCCDNSSRAELCSALFSFLLSFSLLEESLACSDSFLLKLMSGSVSSSGSKISSLMRDPVHFVYTMLQGEHWWNGWYIQVHCGQNMNQHLDCGLLGSGTIGNHLQ